MRPDLLFEYSHNSVVVCNLKTTLYSKGTLLCPRTELFILITFLNFVKRVFIFFKSFLFPTHEQDL